MKISVIGPGAIGSMIGFYGRQAGFEVSFVGRQGPVALRRHFQKASQSFTYEFSLADASQIPDLVFVCVKATQLDAALKAHSRHWPSTLPVVVLCNGVVDAVTAPYGEHLPNLALGFTTIGVRQLADTWVIQNEGGQAIWGADRGKSEQERGFLDKLKPFGFQWDSRARSLRHRKWLFNVVINSLCGTRQIPHNGLLLTDHHAALRETFDEAYQLGLDLWQGWDWPPKQLFDEMCDLITATKDNENSMARDVRLGRPTETSFLAGLHRQGHRPYPLLEGLHQDLMKLANFV